MSAITAPEPAGTAASLAADHVARADALRLAVASALAGANAAVVVATGGLVGGTLSGRPAFATVPVVAFVVGTAAMSVPASMVMRVHGRRLGFVGGAGLGVAGGLVCALAVLRGSFGLFCLGALLCGAYQAFVAQYRFAAADGASPGLRPRVIGWTLAGGCAAAFLGPWLIIGTKDALPPHLFVVTYLGQAGFAALAALVLLGLRGGRVPPPPPPSRLALGTLLADRRLLGAMALGALAQGVMNLVMTSTPLAMVACAHPVDAAALAIQWHILGMYAPSFVTGSLIARFGTGRVALAGFALLALAGVVGLSGIEIAHFNAALILLGLGWNFAFVSATAMVTELAPPAERLRVQGLNDGVVFSFTALAALSSGFLLAGIGWAGVAGTLFPAAVAGAAVLAGLRARRAVPG